MDKGKKNGSFRDRIRRTWISLPLRKKAGTITVLAAFAVSCSILMNLVIAGFGMNGFRQILEDNSRSASFHAAMETESRTFKTMIRNRSEENRAAYEAACNAARKALEALPYDYDETGPERFAKTWSVRNSYDTYEKRKAVLLSMDEDNPEFVHKLYEIYQIQNYIKSYAGSLQEMNVAAGVRRYEKQIPLFLLIPALTILWGALALATVVWLNRSVGRYIVKPVQALAEDSRRIAENDYSGPSVLPEGEDEIADLVRAFCRMKLSTQGYIEALKEKHEAEKQLEAVRLQMLKNQINPHFLFNTLNTIAGAAEMEEAETTEKMIQAMSRLFRYNLKSTASVMPFEREKKVVEDYIYLQKMRFGSRIRYTSDCSQDTMDVMILVFALQPLVENAIVHGLAVKPEGGRLHIRSWIKEHRIFISVSDTGAGIAPERLEEIREELKRGESQKLGIGVSNISRRLKTMYPDGELVIDSREGRGTVVRMAFTASEIF
ncbi:MULTISPECIES: histidine kinase [Hungatella]|uniref:histidine kinase n=1 Tax=Hungatella TaxID=1649459 RepID=UPI0011DE1A84|nr:histidine kinase [Hungatella hathewayi]